MSMIKEVAFVAIAVSDEEGGRNFNRRRSGAKAGHDRHGRAWVEYYDHGATTIGVGCPPVATFKRWDDRRVRSRRHRRHHREAEGARRYVRHGENGDAGLLDGAISRSRRKQARGAQTGRQKKMTTKCHDEGKQQTKAVQSWALRAFHYSDIRHSSFLINIMSVLVDKKTPGRAGNHGKRGRVSHTPMHGVRDERRRRRDARKRRPNVRHKVPVFDTVWEARQQTGCNVSVIFVPAAGAADSILEAVDASGEVVICITGRNSP